MKKDGFNVCSRETNDSSNKIKGVIRRIGSPKNTCTAPGHKPPMNIYLEPGEYEYICPVCGEITIFTVPLILH